MNFWRGFIFAPTRLCKFNSSTGCSLPRKRISKLSCVPSGILSSWQPWWHLPGSTATRNPRRAETNQGNPGLGDIWGLCSVCIIAKKHVYRQRSCMVLASKLSTCQHLQTLGGSWSILTYLKRGYGQGVKPASSWPRSPSFPSCQSGVNWPQTRQTNTPCIAKRPLHALFPLSCQAMLWELLAMLSVFISYHHLIPIGSLFFSFWHSFSHRYMMWQCVKTLYPCSSHQIAGIYGCSSHYSNVSIGIDPYPCGNNAINWTAASTMPTSQLGFPCPCQTLLFQGHKLKAISHDLPQAELGYLPLGCVWKCCVPLHPMVNDHYPY